MQRLKLENFYARSGLFAFLSLSAAALNYALYPALARVLNTRDFGDFTVILALSNQILGILLAFNLTSIYLVKKYPEDEARDKAQVIQKILIWFFVLAAAVLLVFSPFIKQRLQIADPISFVVLELLLITAVPAVIWIGYLQGHKQLVKVGIFNLAAAAAKLLLALVFGALWGVIGSLWGVLTGIILGIVVLRLIAGVRLPSITSSVTALSRSQWTFIRSIYMYIIGSIVVVGMLSILQNIDIIYAKALFTPANAGVYSGISALSNALYFVSFLLVWILLPEVSAHNPTHNRRLLRTAFSLLGALAIGAILAELATRSFLTRLLLGPAFGGQGLTLIIASLFQVALVGTTLYAYYLLVLRKKQALLLASCVFVPTIIVPAFLKPIDTQSMITTLLLALLSGCVIYGIINCTRGVLRHATEKAAS